MDPTTITVTVAESLDADGTSLTAHTPDGTPLPARIVHTRRQYRTAYITWEIALPTPTPPPTDQ